MPRAVSAALQLARDEGHVVRLAAARGAGYLSLAELRGDLPAGAALASLVPLFVCLLGTDQSSDVQRQQLSVRPSRQERSADPAGSELCRQFLWLALRVAALRRCCARWR